MVGKAGYSFLLMEQENNITIFLHPNPKLIGIELEVMAKDNPQLLNIFKTQRQGNDLLKGYYSWKDPGGREEKKFIVILPISNTPLMVATTIDAKEIETLPTEFEKDLLLTKKRFMGGLLIGGIISVAIIVLVGVLFARHWSKPFLELTKVAERIAVGELDATIKITSKDEIGDLADVLRRIQISLKKAIQRLQKNTP
jgi:methyl-accepting chemotaxis protein